MSTAPKQTEAQRLADSISRMDTFTEHQRSEIQKAAALLRRQDELLEQALEALEWEAKGWEYPPDSTVNVMTAIRAHREEK